MTTAHRQSAAFFEEWYQTSNDPWHFASSAYELARYDATLAALSRQSYQRGFEPGCSVGVLTAALALRVDHLLACDISETAVARARERCRQFDHVDIYRGNAADIPPAGEFDLIVFSELGYYFSAPQLTDVIHGLSGRVQPGGEFVAVHWLGSSPDHVLHGDEVHDVLGRTLPWMRLHSARHAGFQIDSWRRAS